MHCNTFFAWVLESDYAILINMSLHILDNSWSNVLGGSDSSNHLPHTDGPEDDTDDQTQSSRGKLKQYDEQNLKEYKKPDRKRKHEKKEQKNVYDKQERNNNYEKPVRNQKYKKPGRTSQYVKPNTNNGERKAQRNEITRLKQELTPSKSRTDHRGRSDMMIKDEELKLESRQSNYEHYDSPEDVLLTSGYHNQISVQDPNYDFTIGKTNSITWNKL